MKADFVRTFPIRRSRDFALAANVGNVGATAVSEPAGQRQLWAEVKQAKTKSVEPHEHPRVLVSSDRLDYSQALLLSRARIRHQVLSRMPAGT